MEKLIAGIVGVGAATALGTLLWAPSAYAPTLACVSGALAGVSVTESRASRRQQKRDAALRAASAFSYLYETNKGIVNPQQVSVLSAQPLEDIVNFLDALSKAQNAKVINTDKGVVYDFPHTNSVLQQLTANAQAWAKSNTDAAVQENAALKQQLAALYQAQANNNAVQAAAKQLKNNEERTDPWNQLL